MNRQQNRALAREQKKQVRAEATGHGRKVGPGRRARWLQHHPKIAGFYQMAEGVLSNGSRSQPPKWKAVRKMMLVLATQPRVKVIGLGDRIPFMLTQGFHERGPWRAYPHVTLDANLKVS